MGGYIRIIIKVDDKIYCQTRWTNAIPNFVQNTKFIECDRDYIHEYLNSPSTYREENEIFSPSGYGIDVFDFDSKQIYSCQYYTDYKTIYKQFSHKEDFENIKDLFEKEYISFVETSISNRKITKNILSKEDVYKKYSKEFNKIRECIIKNIYKDNTSIREVIFNFGNTGWAYSKYNEMSEMYKTIKKLYPLNDEENKEWKQAIEDEE